MTKMIAVPAWYFFVLHLCFGFTIGVGLIAALKRLKKSTHAFIGVGGDTADPCLTCGLLESEH